MIRHITYQKKLIVLITGSVAVAGVIITLFLWWLTAASKNNLAASAFLPVENFIFGKLKIARPDWLKKETPLSEEGVDNSQILKNQPSSEQKEKLNQTLTQEALKELPETLKLEILELLKY